MCKALHLGTTASCVRAPDRTKQGASPTNTRRTAAECAAPPQAEWGTAADAFHPARPHHGQHPNPAMTASIE